MAVDKNIGHKTQYNCGHCGKHVQQWTYIYNKSKSHSCSRYCANKIKTGKPSKRKGKSYLQQYGLEKQNAVLNKLSLSHKGHHSSIKTEFKKGMLMSKETREKIRTAMLRRTATQIKTGLRRRLMSSLEMKFDSIIKSNNLPYVFVGNGSIMIGKKNPDFVHNSKKLAVEVFCKKHKDLFKGSHENWIKERREYFKNYGYDSIFFNETEINETNVLGVLYGR